MTALEYFRMFAPEFASLSDNEANSWINAASEIITVAGMTTEKQVMALALYAAHMKKMQVSAASGGIAVGSVIREKEGDLEREYASTATTSNNSVLSATSYGQQYLQVTAGAFGSSIMTRIGP